MTVITFANTVKCYKTVVIFIPTLFIELYLQILIFGLFFWSCPFMIDMKLQHCYGYVGPK